jgi:translocator protein
MAKYLSLLIFAGLVLAAAATGSQFMPGEWYTTLNKPTWTPPGWLFPIAWTILYLMIAVAGWLAWRAGGIGPAVAIWAAGLVLNALWSYLMFGRHDIGAALFDIVALWLSIAAFIAAARGLDARAAYLFVPYLAWVSFAAALNFAIWQMN